MKKYEIKEEYSPGASHNSFIHHCYVFAESKKEGFKKAGISGIKRNFFSIELIKSSKSVRRYERDSISDSNKSIKKFSKLIPSLQDQVPLYKEDLAHIKDCSPSLPRVTSLLDDKIKLLQDEIKFYQNKIQSLNEFISEKKYFDNQ